MPNFPWQTFVRALLKVGGGYFVQKGITDSSTMEIIVAGLTAIAGVAWGWLEGRFQQKRCVQMLEQMSAKVQAATDQVKQLQNAAPALSTPSTPSAPAAPA